MPRRYPRTLKPQLPLEIVLDEDGRPPHDDQCPTCRLFSAPLPGETWREWLARIQAPAATGR